MYLQSLSLCSEIETVEMHHHDYTIQAQSIANPPPYSGIEKVISLSTDLNDVFSTFCDNLKQFAFALDHPKSITGPTDTTLGKQTPLGSERLKICELFAEFIHLQYLFTSSPLFDMMVVSSPDSETPPLSAGLEGFTVADGLILLTEKFVEEKIMERCIVRYAAYLLSSCANQSILTLFPFRNYFSCFHGTTLFTRLYMT